MKLDFKRCFQPSERRWCWSWNQISSHPDIDMVSFTGSTRAGRLISKNAAETIKRVCLELGGKGDIVFADSYKNAVRDGIRNVMSNSGQSCDAYKNVS